MKRILMLVATVLIAAIAYAKIEVPKSVTIAAKKMPSVTFNHEQHATKLVKSCDVCHHTNKGLTAASEKKPEKCSTCHSNPKDPKVSNMMDGSMTKNPMHMRCIGCHKEQKKGPTVCAKCHVKK